jgi:hypothetical protein
VPLLPEKVKWPLAELDTIRPWFDVWATWYQGDPTTLVELYRERYAQLPRTRPTQLRGGLVGKVARYFWGQPVENGPHGPDEKIHVPVASDVCQTSADLLFSEPIAVTGVDDASMARFAKLLDDKAHSTLAAAAEKAAALGGVFLETVWDTGIADAPFFLSHDADTALPRFAYGRLQSVLMWETLPGSDDQNMWRHLTSHDLDAGEGVIRHGLYRGTSTSLGARRDLRDHPSTAGIAAINGLVDGEILPTGSPGLACSYIRNQWPQRRWREDPTGRYLGRSDLDGLEGLMDQFDAVYSAWMRDIDLGRARILAADAMLDNLGPGEGATFNVDRRIFTPVSMMLSRENGQMPVEFIQAEIRYQAFAATTEALMNEILRISGYSTQTFGDGVSSASENTAAEVHAKERRSYLTRDRKIREQRPELGAQLTKMGLLDRDLFGSTINPDGLGVTFADAVQDSALTLAQTAVALQTAKAASTKTLVKLVHPDWDDTQVDTEVNLIHQEQHITLANPDDIGRNGTGLSPSFDQPPRLAAVDVPA